MRVQILKDGYYQRAEVLTVWMTNTDVHMSVEYDDGTSEQLQLDGDGWWSGLPVSKLECKHPDNVSCEEIECPNG